MKIGVIGCGNLGSSIIRGLLRSGFLKPDEITASDPDEGKLRGLEELGVETTTDNRVAAENDLILLAVKPGVAGEVLDDLRLGGDKLLVSLCAGVSTEYLENHTDARTIRVMPNICGGVGEMASALTPGESATEEDEELVVDMLSELGTAIEVREGLMDIVTGLSGSGPAYILMIIEALREIGEEEGLPEEDALKLAAQTVKGSGELALSSEEGLDNLIDMVCSPKGTTIEGVKVLEERGVKEALKEAVRSATEKSKELSM